MYPSCCADLLELEAIEMRILPTARNLLSEISAP
jgi:hypothetical protein